MVNPTSRFNLYAVNVIAENWGSEPEHFSVMLHCEVSDGGPGGEAFLVNVVSPLALAAESFTGAAVVFGRGLVVMDDFNLPALKESIQGLLDRSGAADWDELTRFVDRYFDWL